MTPDTDSRDAATRTLEERVRHLPVVRDGRVIGRTSARDLLAVAAWPAPGGGT